MRSHGAPSSLGNIVITRDQRNSARADAKGIIADPVNQTTVAISADTSSGYRNLFGDASATELYKGFCDKERYQNYDNDEDRRRKNRRMLRWLALRFARPYNWSDGDGENQRIPAGYTYLAQFVIHDVVQRLRDFPDLRTGTAWPRNDRTSRLVLDTVYGKGPVADPLLYSGCPALPQSKG